jgi:hypothetical protein
MAHTSKFPSMEGCGFSRGVVNEKIMTLWTEICWTKKTPLLSMSATRSRTSLRQTGPCENSSSLRSINGATPWQAGRRFVSLVFIRMPRRAAWHRNYLCGFQFSFWDENSWTQKRFLRYGRNDSLNGFPCSFLFVMHAAASRKMVFLLNFLHLKSKVWCLISI